MGSFRVITFASRTTLAHRSTFINLHHIDKDLHIAETSSRLLMATVRLKLSEQGRMIRTTINPQTTKINCRLSVPQAKRLRGA